jgi:hypothetical protein
MNTLVVVEEFCRAAYGRAASHDGGRATGAVGELLRKVHEGREGSPACWGSRASCRLGLGHSPTVRETRSASRRALAAAGKHRQT